MNKINYQKVLDNTLKKISYNPRIPSLLLHSCCAPCSSYVIEYLSKYFDIYILFYNPNIYPKSEFEFRVKEQEKFVNSIHKTNKVELLEYTYKPDEFYEISKGYENCSEGGDRCLRCYEFRLNESAALAKEMGIDYFTTTLTISPLKNSSKINEIGINLADKYGVNYLQSDFKKREGYKRSIQLSKDFGLYRQSYCGCIFSKNNL